MWRATGREELVVPAGAPATAVSIRVGASTSDSGDAFTADRDWTGTCSAIPGGGAVPVPTTDVALHLFTPLRTPSETSLRDASSRPGASSVVECALRCATCISLATRVSVPCTVFGAGSWFSKTGTDGWRGLNGTESCCCCPTCGELATMAETSLGVKFFFTTCITLIFFPCVGCSKPGEHEKDRGVSSFSPALPLTASSI